MTRETVIFDLGGVVFNWAPLRLLREVFPSRIHDDEVAARWLADIFQSHSTGGDWAQWDLGLVKPHELARRIAQRVNMGEHEILALIDALAPHMRVKDDTVALIHELKAAGHRVLFLSNMPQEMALWIERDHPFSDWFEDGVFSARVGHAKPDKGIFDCAIEKLKLQGLSPIFVDDMAFNVVAAQRIGWRPIQFISAAQTRAELTAYGLVS